MGERCRQTDKEGKESDEERHRRCEKMIQPERLTKSGKRERKRERERERERERRRRRRQTSLQIENEKMREG